MLSSPGEESPASRAPSLAVQKGTEACEGESEVGVERGVLNGSGMGSGDEASWGADDTLEHSAGEAQSTVSLSRTLYRPEKRKDRAHVYRTSKQPFPSPKYSAHNPKRSSS